MVNSRPEEALLLALFSTIFLIWEVVPMVLALHVPIVLACAGDPCSVATVVELARESAMTALREVLSMGGLAMGR